MKKTSLLALLIIMSMLFTLFSCSAMNGDGAGGGSYRPSSPSYGDDGFDGVISGGGSAESAPDMEYGGSMDSITGDGSSSPDESPESPDDGVDSPDAGNVYLPSGMITAGAWNDNDSYSAWIDMFLQNDETNGKFYSYTEPENSWGFTSLRRIKVQAVNNGSVVAGASAVAYASSGEKLFSAVTDAMGNAYLFTDEENGNIVVSVGEETKTVSFSAEDRELTVELSSASKKLDVIEIMFVVDVTGSMGDELNFLKAELSDVINKIAQDNSGAEIKLALLFYRDTDDRVPFDYYDFVTVTEGNGLAERQTALNSQKASGGGDYPEAVDKALEMAVSKQWSTGATTKLIFHILDAPAHSGSSYREKFNNSVETAAEMGIRICPIICSGAAELTEYTMREAAIYTGGTFIFVTDDSGIGGSHHDPELPNVTVELLNSMLIRLVNGYHTGDFAEPIYWKQDPNLNNQ